MVTRWPSAGIGFHLILPTTLIEKRWVFSPFLVDILGLSLPGNNLSKALFSEPTSVVSKMEEIDSFRLSLVPTLSGKRTGAVPSKSCGVR